MMVRTSGDIQIVSGGQTGVDRAALDAAIELGIPHGGWCPKGRLAEDGRIPDKYKLRETTTRAYRERTELNVKDSDATLIITWGNPKGGTGYTFKKAIEYRKPCLIVDMEKSTDNIAVLHWFKENKIMTINIAGPRESLMPGIVYRQALAFLKSIIIKITLN